MLGDVLAPTIELLRKLFVRCGSNNNAGQLPYIYDNLGTPEAINSMLPELFVRFAELALVQVKSPFPLVGISAYALPDLYPLGISNNDAVNSNPATASTQAPASVTPPSATTRL